MTKITVETATLADAVAKAARVSPTKGAAFDKASGILFEIDPMKPDRIYVKSTDLEVTYLQKVPVLHVDAQQEDLWRIPALISNIVTNLPLGIGSELTMERTGPGEITLKCGRKKAKVRSFDPDSFPRVNPFDPRDMGEVEMFPTRLNQAAWATDPESEILSGVHINGTHLVACDRTRLVQVPCKVPVDDPITVPLRAIAPVIRNAGSVKVRVQKDRLQIMPDEDTQITSMVLAAQYPNVKGIIRDNFDGRVSVDREAFFESLNRMLIMVKSERYPRVLVTLRKDSIHIKVSDASTGEMEDEIDAKGGPDVDFLMEFTPSTLTNALEVSTRAQVDFDYGGSVANPAFTANMLPIHFFDDGGFDAWLMPLSPA